MVLFVRSLHCLMLICVTSGPSWAEFLTPHKTINRTPPKICIEYWFLIPNHGSTFEVLIRVLKKMTDCGRGKRGFTFIPGTQIKQISTFNWLPDLHITTRQCSDTRKISLPDYKDSYTTLLVLDLWSHLTSFAESSLIDNKTDKKRSFSAKEISKWYNYCKGISFEHIILDWTS